MAFEKSQLSDTLDAEHYTIYLNELDFVNKEIDCENRNYPYFQDR